MVWFLLYKLWFSRTAHSLLYCSIQKRWPVYKLVWANAFASASVATRTERNLVNKKFWFKNGSGVTSVDILIFILLRFILSTTYNPSKLKSSAARTPIISNGCTKSPAHLLNVNSIKDSPVIAEVSFLFSNVDTYVSRPICWYTFHGFSANSVTQIYSPSPSRLTFPNGSSALELATNVTSSSLTNPPVLYVSLVISFVGNGAWL